MDRNILIDPIIRMSTSGGATVHASLPEIYAALMCDEIDAFPALRPHQRHPWHAFLVQLGVLALQRAGLSEPPDDAEDWRGILRDLTPDFPEDEPWHLVVGDITKPAFMQPPASSVDRQKDYESKNRVETPDELDMLVTGKNHDLKINVAVNADPDDWLFALLTLQTMEGFMGAGNYGIARMNGGASSRPAFSITPSLRWGAHARRDIAALLTHVEEIAYKYEMDIEGPGLLWTLTWDGSKAEALRFDTLSPCFVEVCRRIRLHAVSADRLYATRATSKGERLQAKQLNGRTGDPWTPINEKEGKALTLAHGGFTYKRTVDYISSPDWEHPPLSKLAAAEGRSDEDMMLVARGMVRGMGKTEGYYERTVPLKKKTYTAVFGTGGGSRELSEIAYDRVEQVALVQSILRHAVSAFAAGGKTQGFSPDQRARAIPWANRLSDYADERFFEALQREFEADPGERAKIRKDWLMNGRDGVIDRARAILNAALDGMSCPAIQRYRARVRAENVFEGRIRGPKGFPELFDKEGDEE